MSAPTPRRAFTTDELSVYERVDPDDFPDYDHVDSRVVIDNGAPAEGVPDAD